MFVSIKPYAPDKCDNYVIRYQRRNFTSQVNKTKNRFLNMVFYT